MNRRPWLMAALTVVVVSVARGGEILPNGIELPVQWPPRVPGPLTDEPQPVPYLDEPPAVSPIDLGRQLFVDDFLVESSNLSRVHHRPAYHDDNPVLRPERAWETDGPEARTGVYSDGVWYDPARREFLMWYKTPDRSTCLARSSDGLSWSRPDLQAATDSNVTLRSIRDSATVWLDQTADPSARFRLFEARYKERRWEIALRVSANGEQWSDELAVSGPSWDRSTVFYNPFRKVWVASVRGHDHQPGEAVHRVRCYHEGKTPEAALAWKQSSDEVARGNALPDDLQLWIGADRLDPRHPDRSYPAVSPQLYNLDVFAYESLLVGLFTIWQGPDNQTCKELGLQKRNEVLVGYSRDGFHWHRPDRQPFLPVSPDPKAWNAGNVQSAGGGCLIVEDRLRFYCSGRTMHPRPSMATGLATMRRDGFVSLDAPADGGMVTTRPVRFTGKHLFVNASVADGGELRAEVLDAAGRVVPGYSRRDCQPIQGDDTCAAVRWSGNRDLAALAGQAVKFRFLLTGGSIWSFWVTPDAQGASGGYVAAGGPGFAGSTDAVSR